MTTTIQQLAEIEKLLYKTSYNDLSDYLQGVKDVLHLINDIKHKDVFYDYIILQIEKMKK